MALLARSTDYTDKDFDSLRLRLQNLKGESERMRLQTALGNGTAALKDENSQLRERVLMLEARFGQIEAENQDFAARRRERDALGRVPDSPRG